MMKNKEDWKFDKKKASTALQELSRRVNPFRDENVAELVRVITHCMDSEQALDKACEHLESFDDCLIAYNNEDSNEAFTKEEWKEWLKENDE